MKARKCIHPIKANRIIANFANSAAVLPAETFYDVETEKGYVFRAIANCSIEDIANSCSSKIIDYEFVEIPHYFAVKSVKEDGMQFSVEPIDCDEEKVFINVPAWKTVDYNDDEAGRYFRQDFINRCPFARGFADVTLSVLHEIGHRMTDDLIPKDYDRERAEINCFLAAESLKEANKYYFALPDETLATNWAINWLQNPENRKIAKAFEKKFFACFE